MDVAAGKAVAILEIRGAQDFARDDLGAGSRCDALEHFDDRVPEALAGFAAPAALEVVGRRVRENRHDILARGRERRIVDARNAHVEMGSL